MPTGPAQASKPGPCRIFHRAVSRASPVLGRFHLESVGIPIGCSSTSTASTSPPPHSGGPPPHRSTTCKVAPFLSIRRARLAGAAPFRMQPSPTDCGNGSTNMHVCFCTPVFSMVTPGIVDPSTASHGSMHHLEPPMGRATSDTFVDYKYSTYPARFLPSLLILHPELSFLSIVDQQQSLVLYCTHLSSIKHIA